MTTVLLRPNRALTRGGMQTLAVVLISVPLFGALLSAARGNVYAPLFALFQALIVGPALWLAWRSGERTERIRVDEDVLEVEAGAGRPPVRFQSGWVRVLLHEGRTRQHLLLASHGRELEIGAFLADPEREAAREKLMRALREVRAPQD